jgi:hypothetical protein
MSARPSVDVAGGGGQVRAGTIDLSAIDANSTKAGNQAFHMVDHFTGHAGELRVSTGCPWSSRLSSTPTISIGAGP